MIPKFRAFNKKDNKMYDVSEISFNIGSIQLVPEKGYIEMYDPILFEGEYTLMQSTGLTDKNGKEIYEGDIVQEFDNKYEVKYDLERAGWIPFATDDGCGCCTWKLATVEYSEVIGNIHENSDLIKEGN